MMTSGLYDYVDIMGKAADASWLRNEAITNNISNEDTPGYKRQDVDFESVLSFELGRSRYLSLDQRVKNVDMSRLDVTTYTDAEGYSYRIDGNNVDPQQEQAYLAENQIFYQGITDSITSDFSRIKSVLK
jgi:flagellar basal-body rod protein FlgB